MIRDFLDLEITDKIKHVIRLGRYETNESREHPRLIKVIFDREESASLVLRSAGKLKNVQDGAVKEINIFRDLSQSDREKRKALVEEMKAGNEELKRNHIVDSRVIIRGNKLVKVKVDASKQGKPF